MQFRTEMKAEQQLLRDATFEMMHIVAFADWSAKPKNRPPRGLLKEEAEAEFNVKIQEPDSIVDYLGPSEEYKIRLGVLVKTLVINRNALIKSQGYQLADKAFVVVVEGGVVRSLFFSLLSLLCLSSLLLSSPPLSSSLHAAEAHSSPKFTRSTLFYVHCVSQEGGRMQGWESEC